MDYIISYMDFLPTLRELVRTYQAFETYSNSHIRSLGLSPIQFDVIATLANQSPMTYKELSEKTLISKTSLTGVIERMIQKGYLNVQANEEDGRSQRIGLTAKGQKTFSKAFPEHMGYLEKAFRQLTAKELKNAQTNLARLKDIFTKEKLWNQQSLKKHPFPLMWKQAKPTTGVLVAKAKISPFAMAVIKELNLPQSNWRQQNQRPFISVVASIPRMVCFVTAAITHSKSIGDILIWPAQQESNLRPTA